MTRGALSFVLAFAVSIGAAHAAGPTVVAVPGQPALLLSTFDLAPLGYATDEFFVSGTASSYKLAGPASADGLWKALVAETAPYASRVVVVRPTDPKKFNGTVVVEWLNVSGGADGSPDFSMVHREILRGGYAYMAVSAQKVGVEGGPSLVGAGTPLKKANPDRYGRLSHPGDAYSYDIFSQAGRLLRASDGIKVLGPLVPRRVIAIGESQSAVFLTTYVNAVHPLAKVYDGFVIHSRFGNAASLENASMGAAPGQPRGVKLRTDLREPVITVLTETDLMDSGIPGFRHARQPDTDRLRVWEVPGTAHADNYLFTVGVMDSGSLPLAKLAAAWEPTNKILGTALVKPINNAPQHHYVVQAALWNLDRWIRTGQPPSQAAPIKIKEDAQPSSPASFVLDANGLAEGGVRTPWVDVPTARLSGSGNSGGQLGFLVGACEPFDTATLDRLYPGGKREYVKKVETSLSSAIKAGFILAADKQEILDLAAIAYRGALAPIAPTSTSSPTAARSACASPSPGAPLLVTATCVDPRYTDPYVDIDEPRTTPVPHRYVHGGFKGTDAKFSFYFPPKEQFEGRFFQNTHQLLTSENGPAVNIGFAVASGGYYVQTNIGGVERATTTEQAVSGKLDPTAGGYRVNAEAAKFSKVKAAEIYGARRIYGYLYGGSGGAFQTISSAEHTIGVWDGFVPYVMGSPNAIPGVMTVRIHALRVLKMRDKFPAIMDAIDPGGDGDPYAGLNAEEAAALKEATRMGFPLRGWFSHATMNGGALPLVAGYVPYLDPTYTDDFWTKPGYLGTDPTSSVSKARIQHNTTIVNVIAGAQKRIELSSVPTGDLAGADLMITSGVAAGKTVALGTVNGKTAGFGFGANPAVVNSIQPGDNVRIDNSAYLALQTYHRHQLPTPDMYAWNQFRKNGKGEPIYPQRKVLIGPIGAMNGAGSLQDGRFTGKMIALESLMDIDALPWQADWYRMKVKVAKGKRMDEEFRLYFIDHAQHTPPVGVPAQARTVSYQGALEQALRDVSAWVERGVKPPASTNYTMADSQVEVPQPAPQRAGIQPVVSLAANGAVRADVAVGTPVTFTAVVEVPPNTGKVVAAEWDFEGVGNYPVPAMLADTISSRATVTATYSFSKPGTYFPVLRAASQREGDPKTPYARVLNIGRVRVVVK